MKSEVLNIQGIDVTLFRSLKAKNINITIKPFTGTRVSVPSHLSFNNARDIVEKRISWIKTNLSKMKRAERSLTIFNFDTEFKTREHYLKLNISDSGKLTSVVKNNKISVYIPEGFNVEGAEVQGEVRRAIEFAWRKEAKKYIPIRVKQLAEKYNFQYNKVTIKNTKTRWGSCSYTNNLNLSLHLMRLPDYLIDYVILHELVHTKVKNHGRDFWKMLDKVSGNARKLDKEVNAYRIRIY